MRKGQIESEMKRWERNCQLPAGVKEILGLISYQLVIFFFFLTALVMGKKEKGIAV